MQPEHTTNDASRAFPVVSGQVISQPDAQKKAFTSFDFASFQATSKEQAEAEALSKGTSCILHSRRSLHFALMCLKVAI